MRFDDEFGFPLPSSAPPALRLRAADGIIVGIDSVALLTRTNSIFCRLPLESFTRPLAEAFQMNAISRAARSFVRFDVCRFCLCCLLPSAVRDSLARKDLELISRHSLASSGRHGRKEPSLYARMSNENEFRT